MGAGSHNLFRMACRPERRREGRAVKAESDRGAGDGVKRDGVRGGRTHGPGGAEESARGRGDRQGIGVGGFDGGDVFQCLRAEIVDGMAIEKRGNAVPAKDAGRRRYGCLGRSQCGEQKEEAGEMAGTQAHRYL